MSYRILILAGGGTFGVIPATFLASLDYDFCESIDCIAGCSIGGIEACAYAVGANQDRVKTIFTEHSSDIFTPRFMARLNPLACPKYRNDKLQQYLYSIVRDAQIKDIRAVHPELDFIVPALNLTENRLKVFDNITGEDFNVPMLTVGMSSSAATSYLPGYPYKNYCMVDGGIIEVIPLMTTVMAIHDKKKIPFEEMEILILGTGSYIDKSPITLDEYNGFNLLQVATRVIVPYVTQANEIFTYFIGKRMPFKSFEIYNPIQVRGDLDSSKYFSAILDDCQMYIPGFKRCWNKFIED